MNGMLSVFKNARADSGTSTSPVAQVLNENHPAKKPKARRSASAFGKRTRIIIPILADYRDAFKPIGNRDDSRGVVARIHRSPALPARVASWWSRLGYFTNVRVARSFTTPGKRSRRLCMAT